MDTEITDVASTAPAKSTKPGKPKVKWLRTEVATTKKQRRQLLLEWAINVDYRRGKPFAEASDDDRIQVTIDWSATKAKQSQLFSQVPEVRLHAKSEQHNAAVPTFAKKLNDEMGKARVGVALDEVLPDCINAAGIGAAMVSYESLWAVKSIPGVTPEVAQQLTAAGVQVPMQDQRMQVDTRFLIERVAPGDMLWPTSFTGSDFNDAAFVGRSGRCSWPQAVNRFDLQDDDKEKVLKSDGRTSEDRLVPDSSASRKGEEEEVVNFDELFYWIHRKDTAATSYRSIQHVVFVDGLEEAVINEPWKGQKVTASGQVVGALCYPVQFLTLTYLSDESIPPSDSAMGRAQVNELNDSRSNQAIQRKTSNPLRWFNVNLLDPQVQTNILRGTWNGLIPINGDGNRAIGEIARASYPNDNFELDRVIKGDLSETWQISATQLGGNSGSAIRTAAEASAMQTNFQTRIGYERARVIRFFVNIAEVFGGLLSLYGTFTPEEQQALSVWDRETLAAEFLYSVRADASLLLDASQRTEQLMKVLNMTAKSGYVDVGSIIAEIVELNGLDPAKVMHKPAPPPPEPVNLSIRCSGMEDLGNPLVLALLAKAGQMPSPQELDAAKKVLMSLQQPPPPDMPGGAPGAGGPPPAGGPPAGGPPPPLGVEGGTPPTAPQAPPLPPNRQPPAHRPYQAHKDFDTVSRVEKRQDDGK